MKKQRANTGETFVTQRLPVLTFDSEFRTLHSELRREAGCMLWIMRCPATGPWEMNSDQCKMQNKKEKR